MGTKVAIFLQIAKKKMLFLLFLERRELNLIVLNNIINT